MEKQTFWGGPILALSMSSLSTIYVGTLTEQHINRPNET